MDSEKIEEFFREYLEKEILAAAKQGKKSITVDFDAFDRHCRLMAEKLLNDPETMLPEIEKAASEAIVLPEAEGMIDFRVRFKNLPEHQMVRIRSLRSEHIGRFICVDGIVKRAGEVKPKIDVAEFECECGNKISVKQTEELLRYPSGCDMCGNKRGFKLIDKKLFDSRWLVIEEPFEVSSGEKPGQVSVYMKEDLTSPELQRKCDPGNRIKVTGIIREMPLKTKGGARKVQSDIFVEANHVEPAEIEWEEVEISNKDVEAIKALAADPNVYNRIVASIAPSIYGMEDVKEAILLQMLGGVQQKLPDGTKVRGDIHILLLGDPAVAKSQLLKMVSQLIPRSKYVSGKGASVKANEPVMVRNGHEIKMVPFGEYVNKFYKEGGDGFSPPDRKIEALSLNLSTLKFEWTPIKNFYRHKVENDLIKFGLETGREIAVTDDHSIFTLENGKIVCKQASLLKEGDFVIVPAAMPVENPINIGEDAARLLGYFIAEGHLHYGNGSYKIEFTIGKSEKEITKDIKEISGRLFGKTVSEASHGKNGIRLVINGKEPFLKFKELLGETFGKKAKEKAIPNKIFNSSEKCRKAFVEAYMKGDKGVTKSKNLMSGLLYLLLEDGQIGSCNKREDSGIRIIEGKTITASGKRYDLKSPHPDKTFTNLYKNVPLSACPPLFRKYFFKKISNSKYARANVSRISNKLLLERLMFVGNKKIQTREIRKKFGDKISPYMTSKKRLFKTERVGNDWFVSLSDEGKNTLKEYEEFKKLCESDMGFVKIKSISKEKPESEYVYDFSVEGENFVSGFGGILCHNTGAGLTATVFRDEELMGGWVLEAGAMVLCHKGVIAIDEFDKMGRDDQIAMHEALEQQSYHPSTEITLADGSKHKIGMLVDGLMERNKNKIIEGKDCEILPTNDISILTTDFSKIYTTKINRVSRHIAPERFVNIAFSNGRSILVTPEHPVFVLDGAEIKTVPADSAKKDMFVPMPKNLPFSSADEKLKRIEKTHFNEKNILQPEKMTAKLARVMGYYVSEGHSFIGERCREIGFTNSDEYILGDIKSSMQNAFGMQPYSYERHPNVFINRYSSTQLHRFFESNFPETLKKARDKKIPEILLKCDENVITSFLSAAYLGDGFVDSERFGLSTTSLDLAKGYQELLLKLGIYSYIAEDRKQKAFKVVISGTENMKLFLENIVDAHDYRRDRINAFIGRSAGKNRQRGDFPYDFGFEIKKILSLLKIDDGYFQPSLKNGVTEQTIRKYIGRIREKTGCVRKAIESERDMAKLRDSCKVSQQDIENKYGVKRQTISYIERCKFHKRKDEIMGFIKAISREMIKTAEETCKTLEKFLDSDISWIRIKNAEFVENKDCKYVYDVTVEPTKSFISECLVLHNTISIAKASIIATLPAQVSVLAGANPKFSRFDVYRPLMEQTDIPDTLLSRFDLKFALRDVPDREKDEKLATHVLESRMNPELRRPEISQEFMRKYIAYVRQNSRPQMTKEALERIKNFYVTMRGMYKGEDTVAITLRQNEALLRLSEASAKVRLSQMVEQSDAERAIKIMKVSLQQFGYDYETGKIDIDRTEGTSSSQRSKIRVLLDVIEALEKKIGKQIPKEDIIAEAEDHGLKGVDEMIQKMKSEGMLFEPKHNVIQKL